MSGNFVNFWNTHYCAVSLGVEHQKKVGFIKMADSINKNLSPNQIQKGQKVYDWENEFYMNLEPSDTIKLSVGIQTGLNGNPVNVSIFTDQSKSSYNPRSIKTKTLILSNTDQNGNIKKDKDGNIVFNLIGNLTYINGNKSNIYYPLGVLDIQMFLSWTKYCQLILPGIGVLLDDLCYFLTGKNSDEIKKERYSQKNNNNQNNNNYQNNNQSNNNYQNNNYQNNNNQSNAPSFNQSQQDTSDGTPFIPPSNQGDNNGQAGGGILF